MSSRWCPVCHYFPLCSFVDYWMRSIFLLRSFVDGTKIPYFSWLHFTVTGRGNYLIWILLRLRTEVLTANYCPIQWMSRKAWWSTTCLILLQTCGSGNFRTRFQRTAGKSANNFFEICHEKYKDLVLIKIPHAHINKQSKFSLLNRTLKYRSQSLH